MGICARGGRRSEQRIADCAAQLEKTQAEGDCLRDGAAHMVPGQMDPSFRLVSGLAAKAISPGRCEIYRTDSRSVAFRRSTRAAGRGFIALHGAQLRRTRRKSRTVFHAGSAATARKREATLAAGNVAGYAVEFLSEFCVAWRISGWLPRCADLAHGGTQRQIKIWKTGQTAGRAARSAEHARMISLIVDLETEWRGGQNQALLTATGMLACGHDAQL